MKHIHVIVVFILVLLIFQCNKSESLHHAQSQVRSIPRFMISAPEGWKMELVNPPENNVIAIMTPLKQDPKNSEMLMTVSLVEKDSILTMENIIQMDKNIFHSKFGDISFEKLTEIQVENKKKKAELYKVTIPGKSNLLLVAYIEEVSNFVIIFFKAGSHESYNRHYEDFLTVVKSYKNMSFNTI